MICKIAEFIVDIPEEGGLAPLFGEYLYEGKENIEIRLDPAYYDPGEYPFHVDYKTLAYLESGRQFFASLIGRGGFYLHSSSVEYEGRAYIFSAKSGTGKSTHTRLWKETFGESVQLFNDDKTPLRRINGVWYAYGAPWCGKDHINQNIKVPVGAICFLKQAPENRIRRLSAGEAIPRMLNQTLRRFTVESRLDQLLTSIDQFLKEIPVFELENRPEPAAAILSYEIMKKAAEEMGL